MKITARQMLVYVAGIAALVGLFMIVALTIYGYNHGFQFGDEARLFDFFAVSCGLVGVGGFILWVDAAFWN